MVIQSPQRRQRGDLSAYFPPQWEKSLMVQRKTVGENWGRAHLDWITPHETKAAACQQRRRPRAGVHKSCSSARFCVLCEKHVNEVKLILRARLGWSCFNCSFPLTSAHTKTDNGNMVFAIFLNSFLFFSKHFTLWHGLIYTYTDCFSCLNKFRGYIYTEKWTLISIVHAESFLKSLLVFTARRQLAFKTFFFFFRTWKRQTFHTLSLCCVWLPPSAVAEYENLHQTPLSTWCMKLTLTCFTQLTQ